MEDLMGTGKHTGYRTNKRSVTGSILGSLLLAGLVAMALELIAVAFAGPNSVSQKLARSTESFVTLERHVARGGAITSYQIRF
jgi:hypothetical protein